MDRHSIRIYQNKMVAYSGGLPTSLAADFWPGFTVPDMNYLLWRVHQIRSGGDWLSHDRHAVTAPEGPSRLAG